MKLWSGKSLDERVALIKRRYPYAHVTIYKLRKLYKEKKIKHKVIRKSKDIPDRVRPNYA